MESCGVEGDFQAALDPPECKSSVRKRKRQHSDCHSDDGRSKKLHQDMLATPKLGQANPNFLGSPSPMLQEPSPRLWSPLHQPHMLSYLFNPYPYITPFYSRPPSLPILPLERQGLMNRPFFMPYERNVPQSLVCPPGHPFSSFYPPELGKSLALGFPFAPFSSRESLNRNGDVIDPMKMSCGDGEDSAEDRNFEK